MGIAASSARADDGAVSSLALSIIADGSVPFDAAGSTDAGTDTGPSNGIVRTLDTVTYGWSFTTTTPGDIALTQELPAGMTWEPLSLAGCEPDTSSISADGRTIKCTLQNLPLGVGGFQVIARVGGAVGNGTTLSSAVTSGGAASLPAAVTVAAGAPQVQTTVGGLFGSGSTIGGVQGLSSSSVIELWTAVDPATGLRGREALSSDFSFQIDVSGWGPNAVATFCSSQDSSSATLPYGRLNVAGATPSNSVRESGVWTCDQPGGPGTPVTVTVTGADMSGSTYPSKASGGTDIDPGTALLAIGRIDLWTPLADHPPVADLTARIVGFDPSSASGQSNFGTGVAPGQEPGADCVAGQNCIAAQINTTVPLSVQTDSSIAGPNAAQSMGSPMLLGQTSPDSGDAPLLPGQTFSEQMRFINHTITDTPATNVSYCTTFDPSLVTVDASRAIKVISAFNSAWPDSSFVVEYGTSTYADDVARKATDCGRATDGASGWFPSVAAAGGAENVSAVRIRLTHELASTSATGVAAPYNTGGVIAVVPFKRTEADVPAGTLVPVFSQMTADGMPLLKSNYDVEGSWGARGARAIASTVTSSVSTTWDAPTAKAGTSHEVTVVPTVTSGYTTSPRTARATTVTVSLDSPDLSYVANSASVTPISVTPATATAGPVLTFDLGDISTDTPISPITFKVNASPLTPMPSSVVAHTEISTVDDASPLALRTSAPALQINSPAELLVTMLESTTFTEPGDPFEYTLGWSNQLSSSLGVTKLVDVLPYDGDANGTVGMGALNVDGVTTTDGSLVEYTKDTHENVLAALGIDATGDSGIGWSTTRPADGAGVTAIRITTPELVAKATGSATVNVTATKLATSSELTNSITSAQAATQSTPLRNLSPVTMSATSSSIAGNVYRDEDFSGDHGSNDTPLASATLSLTGYSYGLNGIDDGGPGVPGSDDVTIAPLTTTSDADGTYSFTSLHSGSYAVAVASGVPNTLAAQEVPSDPIAAERGAEVTDANFGFQRIIPAPIMVDDDALTHSEQAVRVSVLANDSVDYTAEVTSVSTPEHGEATIDPDHLGVSYVPAPGFVGTDSFTYTATDASGQAASATVTVRVIDWPVAVADSARTAMARAVEIPALANDSGDALTIASVSHPLFGTASITPDGRGIVYTPNADFSGSDGLSYSAVDSAGASTETTVTISVVAAPAPHALDVTTDQDQSVGIDVLSGYPRAADATVSASAQPVYGEITNVTVTQPAHGIVEFGSDFGMRYTPAPGYSGTDSLSYTLVDDLGQVGTATIAITVVPAAVVPGEPSTVPSGTPSAAPSRANNPTSIGGEAADPIAGETGKTTVLSSTGASVGGVLLVAALSLGLGLVVLLRRGRPATR